MPHVRGFVMPRLCGLLIVRGLVLSLVRPVVTFVACLLTVHFATKPIEIWINYMALGWGTNYLWPFVIYAAECLCLFILAGLALTTVGGFHRRRLAVAAVFGAVCMVGLALRNPFLSVSPTIPSWPQVLLAYAHILTAPLGAVLGAMFASRFFQKRSSLPPNKSLERTRER